MALHRLSFDRARASAWPMKRLVPSTSVSSRIVPERALLTGSSISGSSPNLLKSAMSSSSIRQECSLQKSFQYTCSTKNLMGVEARRLFGTTVTLTDHHKTGNGAYENNEDDIHAEEQQREHCFSATRDRDTVERLDAHSSMSLSEISRSSMQAAELADIERGMGDYDSQQYNSTGCVSLSGVMQSNVPQPFQSSQRGTPSHLNMPGGGSTRQDKYIQGHIKEVHPSRQMSTQAKSIDGVESLHTPYSDMQGLQGPITTTNIHKLVHLENPCPQGVQGENCDRFKLWLNNCIRYGFTDCEDHLKAYTQGRKTLPQIFAEQEKMIQDAALQYRRYSTSAKQDPSDEKGEDQVSTEPALDDKRLSQKDRLKRAVKEYGGTVIVFHVTISLMSLGAAYLAVSSGLDVVALLEKMGVGRSVLESRLATGASTFVVAYAVHKVFAPARIAITLTSTPFIVRYLRRVGFLKTAATASSRK